MGLFSSTGRPSQTVWTAAGGRGEGVEWRGREWSGGEGRGGKGRAGQGRVPDCLGRDFHPAQHARGTGSHLVVIMGN